MPWTIPVLRKVSRKIHTATSLNTLLKNEPQDLQEGDWVEVKTADEIKGTLDKNGKAAGLYYMAEMWKFCGKRYKVIKKVKRIKVESTGELRILKTPSYFLEGVYCDGEFHENCDRSCFLFWREDWLKKIALPQ